MHGGLAQRRHGLGVCRPAAIVAASKGAGSSWTGVIKLGGQKKGKKEAEKPAQAPEEPKQQQQHAPRPVHDWRQAVVQVLAEHDLPNYSRPWNHGRLYSSSSSGVVVNAKEGLVLTTAGAVHYAPRDTTLDAHVVDIRLHSLHSSGSQSKTSHSEATESSAGAGPTTAEAEVLAVSWEADLALLKVQSCDFPTPLHPYRLLQAQFRVRVWRMQQVSQQAYACLWAGVQAIRPQGAEAGCLGHRAASTPGPCLCCW